MKLLDNARKGDVVVVWKLDWLARSIRQLIDTTAMLNECGVELHSLTENINTTSGKLTFHIFAALAEFERDILRQRVNAGLKAARRRGRIGGRPKALGEAELKKARHYCAPATTPKFKWPRNLRLAVIRSGGHYRRKRRHELSQFKASIEVLCTPTCKAARRWW